LPRNAQLGAGSVDRVRRTTSPVAPAVILAADANSILYALTDKARIVFSFNPFAIHGFRAL
jgi:hypothetical protein